MESSGLTQKIFRYFVVMTVLGIVVTLALSYQLHLNYYRRAVEHNLIEESRNVIRLVDTGIFAGLQYAHALSQTAKIPELLARSPTRTDPPSFLNLRSFLTARVWHITVLDTTGKVLESTKTGPTPAHEEEWLKWTISHGKWIGEPYRDPGEDIPLLPIAVVAENPETGGAIGVVRVELNWQNVIDAVGSLAKGRRSRFAFVGDAQGRIIALPDLGMNPNPLRSRENPDLVRYVGRHNSGVVRTRLVSPVSRKEEPFLMGFAHSSGIYEYPTKLGWWAAVASSEFELHREVYVSMLLGVTLTSLVAALLFLGVFLGTRTLLKPLNVIASRMSRFGRGDTDARLDIRTGDELELLATTFNEMAGGLTQSREQLEAKVNELFTVNENLKEMARLKAQLIANVSHELRTPLHSIIGFTELTIAKLRGSIQPLQEQNLERVRKNAYHLMDLVNQILDFSRIESGTMIPRIEEFELREEISTCCELVSPLVSRNIELCEEQGDSILIRSDRLMVRQVLVNLLANAAKFTEKGQIRIAAVLEKEQVSVSVSDTGVGIDANHLGIIFDAFRQVDGSSQRRYGGTGLGLAIVKRMLEMLEGEIHVESQLEVGSTFTVILPKSGPRTNLETAQPPPSPESSTSQNPKEFFGDL